MRRGMTPSVHLDPIEVVMHWDHMIIYKWPDLLEHFPPGEAL